MVSHGDLSQPLRKFVHHIADSPDTFYAQGFPLVPVLVDPAWKVKYSMPAWAQNSDAWTKCGEITLSNWKKNVDMYMTIYKYY